MLYQTIAKTSGLHLQKEMTESGSHDFHPVYSPNSMTINISVVNLTLYDLIRAQEEQSKVGSMKVITVPISGIRIDLGLNLQNCEKTNLHCLGRLSLWYFVMAILAN